MELVLPWGHSANLDVASGEQGDRRPGWPVCRIAKSYPGRVGGSLDSLCPRVLPGPRSLPRSTSTRASSASRGAP